MTDEKKPPPPPWSVVDVGGKLMHSTGRNAFAVMRVSDAEDAIDALVEKAADAVARWRERAVALGFVIPQGCAGDGSCEVKDPAPEACVDTASTVIDTLVGV